MCTEDPVGERSTGFSATSLKQVRAAGLYKVTLMDRYSKKAGLWRIYKDKRSQQNVHLVTLF